MSDEQDDYRRDRRDQAERLFEYPFSGAPQKEMDCVCASCGSVERATKQIAWYRHIYLPARWMYTANDRSVRCYRCSVDVDNRSSTRSADDDLVRVSFDEQFSAAKVTVEHNALRVLREQEGAYADFFSTRSLAAYMSFRDTVAGGALLDIRRRLELAGLPSDVRTVAFVMEMVGQRAQEEDGEDVENQTEIEHLRRKLDEAQRREEALRAENALLNISRGVQGDSRNRAAAVDRTPVSSLKEQGGEFLGDMLSASKLVAADKTGEMAIDFLNMLLKRPPWLQEMLKHRDARELIKISAMQIAKGIAKQTAPDSKFTAGLSGAASAVTVVGGYKIMSSHFDEVQGMMKMLMDLSKSMEEFDPETFQSAMRVRVEAAAESGPEEAPQEAPASTQRSAAT